MSIADSPKNPRIKSSMDIIPRKSKALTYKPKP